jgi:hypothetical protein
MAVMTQTLNAQTILAVTALQSLASSQTAGWKSVMIDNTSAGAVDYEVFVKVTTANTAPANDKAIYIYIVPWYYDLTNTTWYVSDGGTGTLPSSSDATYTIASPNDLYLAKVLNYTTQQMIMQGSFCLSSIFGNTMPDGFSIVIINYSGAALSTGCIVDVKPITYTIA